MLKKLMNKKKNNKGFSLVELIVVVLIIAIIAVALAPQIMKWVGTSRDNTDENNAAVIKSAALVGVAEFQSERNGAPTLANTPLNNLPAVPALEADIDTVGEYIRASIGDIPLTNANGQFSVEVTATGDVIVSWVDGNSVTHTN